MPVFWNFEQANGLKSLQVEARKQVEVVEGRKGLVATNVKQL